MKLIITIIPGNECDNISMALTERKFRVTKIASTRSEEHTSELQSRI